MAWSGYLLDLVVFFEFGGAAVSEGGVQPGAVVPGDVLDGGVAGGRAGGPLPGVDQLPFDRGEERFGQGVIPALAGPADRKRDLALRGEGSELRGGVLAPAVGMEDHSRAGVPRSDSVGQRGGGQLGAQVISQGEPDD